jgi:hypothetical protein
MCVPCFFEVLSVAALLSVAPDRHAELSVLFGDPVWV